ncbi:FMN-binding protein [Microbacterium aurantiacum]|uniref:FMN-binding protein n=1 Tax=Microbacterium aurantiacum TaxID=162393 RepID=UPI000C7FF292|nr:FMN-binding protein [Microbacterium aurantiacum]
MIRTTVPTSVRKGAALAGIAGLLVLAGCSGAADAESNADTGTNPEPTTSSAPADDAATDSAYKDGTYTAEGSYQTPETVEKISVTLTLADGVVTDVEVTGDPQAPETEKFQGEFVAGIADVVEGVPIDELKVDKVAGSSLTSGGFNQALETIKEEAAA